MHYDFLTALNSEEWGYKGRLLPYALIFFAFPTNITPKIFEVKAKHFLLHLT